MRSIEKLLKVAKEIEEITAPARAKKVPSLPPPPMASEPAETIEDTAPPSEPKIQNRPRVLPIGTVPVLSREQLIEQLEEAYELLDQDLDRQTSMASVYRGEADDPTYPAEAKSAVMHNIRRQNLLTLFCTRYLNPWFEQVIEELRADLSRPVDDQHFFARLESRFNNLLKKVEEIKHYAKFGRFYTSDRTSVELGGPTRLDLGELYSLAKLKTIIHNQKSALNKTPVDIESIVRHQEGLPVQ